MKWIVWGSLGLSVLGLCGCATTGMEQRRQQEQRLISDVRDLRVALERMEHRVAGLTREQEQLGTDVMQVQQEMQQYQEQQDAALSGITARLAEQDRARQALRQELADTLSQKISALLQEQARTRTTQAQGRRSGNLAQVGYEHEVQAGETLSEIARAYGVSSAAILDANDMRNPDVLRVGQVLFIPQQ